MVISYKIHFNTIITSCLHNIHLYQKVFTFVDWTQTNLNV